MSTLSSDFSAEIRISDYTKLRLSDVVAIAILKASVKDSQLVRPNGYNDISITQRSVGHFPPISLLEGNAAGKLWEMFGRYQYPHSASVEEKYADAVFDYVKDHFTSKVDIVDPTSSKHSDLNHLTGMTKTLMQHHPVTSSDATLLWLVTIVMTYLDSVIEMGKKKAIDEYHVRQRIAEAEAENRKYIVLDERTNYSKILTTESNCLFVVFPSAEGWCTKTISRTSHRFMNRKDLPATWAGLKGNALARVTGVYDAVFCHKDRFICGADSREGAIKLAQKAVEATE